jgi:Rieske Fe-S protein
MAGGAAAVAGLAAACAVGGSDPSSAPTGSSGTSNGTGSAAGSGTAQPAAIVALADVPVGGAMAATIDGAPAVVARPKDRTVAAFSARCTHMGCTVAVAGAKLQCPCHGSQFDALTGAVLRGPATEALPKISVHLDGDEVVAG